MLAHGGRVSSPEVRGCAILGLLAIVISPLDGQNNPGDQLKGDLAALRSEFPGRFQASYQGLRISERLGKLADASPGDPAEGEARRLAAGALEDAGEPALAQEAWKKATQAGSAADRAQASFAIGLGYFFKERYDITERYWRNLPDLAPDSPWTARAARFRPYMDMVRGGEVPPFEAEFAPPGGPAAAVHRDGLKDRTVILFFWSVDSLAGTVDLVEKFDGQKVIRNRLDDLLRRTGTRSNIAVEVLGVNMDTDRKKFEEAVGRWKLPWPQHHDGLAFGGPLVRTLGIPRLPHFVLMGPDGRSRYAGSRIIGKRSLEEALSSPRQKAGEK
jgi:tetratricopeptide (TPR) repeat protein